jgi:hypothetical protein
MKEYTFSEEFITAFEKKMRKNMLMYPAIIFLILILVISIIMILNNDSLDWIYLLVLIPAEILFFGLIIALVYFIYIKVIKFDKIHSSQYRKYKVSLYDDHLETTSFSILPGYTLNLNDIKDIKDTRQYLVITSKNSRKKYFILKGMENFEELYQILKQYQERN